MSLRYHSLETHSQRVREHLTETLVAPEDEYTFIHQVLTHDGGARDALHGGDFGFYLGVDARHVPLPQHLNGLLHRLVLPLE